MVTRVLDEFVPDPHECETQKIVARPFVGSGGVRVITSQPTSPHPVDRAGLDENTLSGIDEEDPQPFVLCELRTVAVHHDLETVLPPNSLVKVAYRAPQSLRLTRVRTGQHHFGDLDITEETGLAPHHVVLGAGEAMTVHLEPDRPPLTQTRRVDRVRCTRSMPPEL